MKNYIEIDDVGKQCKFIDGRFYLSPSGRWLPGYTEVMSVISKGSHYERFLMSNGFNAQIIAREAMEQGSKVHHAIEQFLKDNPVEIKEREDGTYNYTEEEWKRISKFMDFYAEFQPEVIGVESVMASDNLGYGSQLDLICRMPIFDNQLIYIDHKTGGLYDTVDMQLAASAMLWNSTYPDLPIQMVAVLHLDAQTRGRDKKGKNIQGKGWKLEIYEDYAKSFNDFQHVFAIWKRKNPDFKPMNVTLPASYNQKMFKEGFKFNNEINEK